MISFQDNIREFQSGLSDLALRQIPFAASQALNDTAEDVADAWRTHMERRIDRPTPFTLRGVHLANRARKAALTAVVGIRPLQAGYLKYLAQGGTRYPMGRALVVPVAHRLNQYGNIPRRGVASTLRRKRVFAGKVRGKGGVWERPTKRQARSGAGPKLLVAFRSRASYDARLDLDDIAVPRARQSMPEHFSLRFRQAIATAR